MKKSRSENDFDFYLIDIKIMNYIYYLKKNKAQR